MNRNQKHKKHFNELSFFAACCFLRIGEMDNDYEVNRHEIDYLSLCLSLLLDSFVCIVCVCVVRICNRDPKVEDKR